MENMTDYHKCKIIRTEISDEDIQKKLGKAPGLSVSIMPESEDGGIDVLNAYTANMKKLASRENIPCEVIHGDDYRYLELKSADIILPFIISLSASICCELLVAFIKRFFLQSPDTIKARMITKQRKESKYEKIEINGSAVEVIKALEAIKAGDATKHISQDTIEGETAIDVRNSNGENALGKTDGGVGET